MDSNIYKPKQLRLRQMPKDVYDLVITAQAEQKKKCNCQYNIEQTIYLMIRKLEKRNERD